LPKKSGPRFKVYTTYTALSVPVFVVEYAGEETYYYITKPAAADVVETNKSALDNIFTEKTDYILGEFAKNPERFREEHEYWLTIKNRAGEVEKIGEKFKVREDVNTFEGGLDGKVIDDVPDFHKNSAPRDYYGGDCWVWATVAGMYSPDIGSSTASTRVVVVP